MGRADAALHRRRLRPGIALRHQVHAGMAICTGRTSLSGPWNRAVETICRRETLSSVCPPRSARRAGRMRFSGCRSSRQVMGGKKEAVSEPEVREEGQNRRSGLQAGMAEGER